jgi:hypothetical protein
MKQQALEPFTHGSRTGGLRHFTKPSKALSPLAAECSNTGWYGIKVAL